jgi:hypothetical protein
MVVVVMHTININQYTNPSLQARSQENTKVQLFCQISDMYVLISGQQQNVSLDTDSLVYMEIYLTELVYGLKQNSLFCNHSIKNWLVITVL